MKTLASIRRAPRCALLAALCTALALPLASHAQQVGVGTMAQGTLGYSIGSAISKVLADNGISARVQPAGGTSAYLPLLESGELDFGIANVVETTEAMAGDGPFAGRKLGKLRAVSVLFPFRVGLFVKADSGIERIEDLKGRSVTYGYVSQVTIRRVVDALLANGGLTASDIKPVLVPNVVRGATDFASGKADAAFFAIGAGKVAEVDASVGGVRFLPLSSTPEATKALKAVVPEAYIGTVKPGKSLAGIPKDTPAMMYDYLLVAGAHVKPQTVQKVVEVLNTNKAALAASFAAFNAFDPTTMAKDLPVQWHEGAQAAYTRLGQWPPKK